MKNKFLMAIVYIVFSLILFIVAVIPAFAAGGGGGTGSSFAGLLPPCSMQLNLYRARFNNNSQSYDWSYNTLSIDPCFNIRRDSNNHFVDSIGPYSTLTAYSRYRTNLVSTESSGYAAFDFDVTTDSTVESLFFVAQDFYCWSDGISYDIESFGESEYNSEFVIAFNLDRDQVYFNDYALVKFLYRPVGDSYDENGYLEVTLPLRDFYLEDVSKIFIDPGAYFASDSYTNVYYHVLDFSIRIPCVIGDRETISCEAVYIYNNILRDPTKLYPTVRGSIEIQDYTSWVTTALSGFLNFQIFPGFYLSGFLMVIIAFSTFIWFLKIFAGG